MEKLTESRNLVQDEVKQALKWTDLEYAEYVYETGISYMKHYLQEDVYVDEIIKNRVFWNWWKIQWHLRDVEFLSSVKRCHDKSVLRDIYGYLHDAEELAKCMHPHAIILEESYPAMIGMLIKLEQRKAELAPKKAYSKGE